MLLDTGQGSGLSIGHGERDLVPALATGIRQTAPSGSRQGVACKSMGLAVRPAYPVTKTR